MGAAPKLTIGFVVFNTILFIMLAGFGIDSVSVGSTGTNFDSVSSNYSDSQDVSVSEAKGWFGGFITTVTSMPWWVNTLMVVFQSLFLTVIVLAWIRGV